MPEQFTEADVARILEATRAGKLPGQIAREMSEPLAPPAGLITPETEAARAAASASAALHAEGTPAGQEPTKPIGLSMMDAAFAAQGGQRVRPAAGMGDKAVEAGLNVLFARAAADDDQAVYKRPTEGWDHARQRYEASKR